MATTTNYGWTTPDDTALVKDGAAAIRSLGTSVDTTTKNLNPSTTLGDIEYRSSTANTNTRLGIGTTGQVLTVSGGVPSWATAAGGASFTLLNSGGTALTGASSITIGSISGQNQLLVAIHNASSASGASVISVQLNADATAKHNNYYTSITAESTYSSTNYAGTSTLDTDEIFIGRMGSTATTQVRGALSIDGCNASGVKVYEWVGGGSNASVNQDLYAGKGYYTNSTTISSIKIISSIGNFDNGTVYVYGSAG